MESIHNESERIVKFPSPVAEGPEQARDTALAATGTALKGEEAAEQVAPSEIGRWVQKLAEMDEDEAIEKGRALAEDPSWPDDRTLDLTAERILAHEAF